MGSYFLVDSHSEIVGPFELCVTCLPLVCKTRNGTSTAGSTNANGILRAGVLALHAIAIGNLTAFLVLL